MRPTKLLALALALAVSASPALAQEKPLPVPAKPPVADSCTDVRGGTRFEAYGYTHVVTLRNRCVRAVRCELWTNVDPEPRVRVELASGESTDVITRRGSPAREVTAYKKCSFR